MEDNLMKQKLKYHKYPRALIYTNIIFYDFHNTMQWNLEPQV